MDLRIKENHVQCTDILKRLEFLRPSSSELRILLNAARDDYFMSDIPLELIMELLKKLALILSTYEQDKMDKRGILVLELIATLVSSGRNCQIALKLSSCLDQVLRLFNTCDLMGGNCLAIKLLDIILSASIFVRGNKEHVTDIVQEKVVAVLRTWGLSANDPRISSNKMLETTFHKLFVLGKVVINKSVREQLLFVSMGGLQHLKRCLEKNFDAKTKLFAKSPGGPTLDGPRSLFSSLTWLLDAVLTHNKRTCEAAYKMGIANALLQSLDQVPKMELDGAVSSIMHMVEAQVYDITTLDLKKIIVTVQDRSFRKEDIGQPMIQFIEKLNMGTTGTSRTRKRGSEHKDADISIQKTFRLPSASTHTIQKKIKEKFISKAELMIFINCISVHGVNMQVVRRHYPFHLDMTPNELYILWRRMWELSP